jgi:hypothetical protein
MSVAMQDNEKAYFLSIALCCFELVKDHEPLKSARYLKLVNALNNTCKAVDLYRPEAWCQAEMDKATVLFDEISIRVRETFNAGDVQK